MRLATYHQQGVLTDLLLSVEEKLRHCYVGGKSGMGKSNLLEQMALHAIRSDHGLLFIDPHGLSVDSILKHIPRRRINDVVVLSPDHLIAINPLYNPTDPALAAENLTTSFQAIYRSSWGYRLEEWLFNGLLYRPDHLRPPRRA